MPQRESKRGNDMEQDLSKPASTTKLLERLFQAPNINAYLSDNAEHLQMPAFDQFIRNMCIERSLSRSAVIARSDIPRNYAYQLFNGIRKPSRDKVIQLAFGFGLDVEGAQELLKLARLAPLYPKIPRDIVLLRCLHEKRSVWDAQTMLDGMGLMLLGREDKNE